MPHELRIGPPMVVGLDGDGNRFEQILDNALGLLTI